VHGAAEFFGCHHGAVFIADLAIGNDKHGGGMLAAMRPFLGAQVFESGNKLGAAIHPDEVNGRTFGTEVDVGGADQFGFVVADAAFKEREPDTGLGMQARDKSGESFACSGPVVAAHAAAAIEKEVDVE